MSDDTLIIGIGNRYRGDDALGCLIADQLKAAGADAVAHDGEPASLIDLWQGRGHVILVDAVSSNAPAGTIHCIDLHAQALPEHFRSHSTHAFGVAEAVELARVLGKLPRKIVFYGVEGKSFAAATQLSDALQETAETLRLRILNDIRKEKDNA